MRTIGIALVGLVALAACERSDPRLLNIAKASRAPDEFSILPSNALEAPEDFSTLPVPTPGGTNRTDKRPLADAIVALGGNPERGAGVDGALSRTVTRFGLQPGIREVLAAEDLDYRRKNDGRLLERLFNVNVYFRAYAPLSLDQYAELERLRRAGVRTVAAPPDPALLDE